jgi:methionyl-tRNA formyltransferase
MCTNESPRGLPRAISFMKKYTVVFFGTSKFAVPALQELAKSKNFAIRLVVSQPDAPVGKKKILTPTAVKTASANFKLAVFTPEKLKDQGVIKKIVDLAPDFLVVAAYGQILPKELLQSSKYGAVNIHPSLLPKYRGPSPIQSVILNGETETGVTIMLMDEEVDHGPIGARQKVQILPDETAPELETRLAEIGAALLLEVLEKLVKGAIKPVPQNHEEATLTKILSREDGHVDWKKPVSTIYNLWRAFQPWPGVFTELRIKNRESKMLKLIKIKVSNLQSEEFRQYKIAEVFERDKKLFVKCGDGLIEIARLQLEGKKAMDAGVFLQGHREIEGASLS